MSASFYRDRPNPAVREMLVSSLAVTPPDRIQFEGMLRDAMTACAFVVQALEERRPIPVEEMIDVEQRCAAVARAADAINACGGAS